MTEEPIDARKKERSPSFPFISLRKALERARAVHDKYRKEPARVIVVGGVWGLGAKSSGLLQTVAALKQYGLMEDSGSKEDRKVTLTPLALRILLDTRPGQREDGLREAALKPRLFQEYVRWSAHRLPDAHSISELHLERGFTEEAAKTFLRVFFETMTFAGIGDESDDENLTEDGDELSALGADQQQDRTLPAPRMSVVESVPSLQAYASGPAIPSVGPLSERIKVELTPGAIRVAAMVRTPAEADVLIQFIQANKALLSALPDVL